MEELNLNFIQSFEILSKTLNFSEASKTLELAQSNVSRQIKVLEKSLGVQLFHRTRQGAHLTVEGIRFKNEVLPLLQALNEKVSLFKKDQTEESGEIRLSSFSEVGMNFFMPLCLEFQRNHPQVRLEMKYLGESEILKAIQLGKIEFGIISHPPIIEGLAAYPVMKQKILLLAPPSFSGMHARDIEQASFASFEKSDSLLMTLWNKKISKRKKPKITITVNSHRSMLDAVMQNECLAVLPRMSAEALIKRNRVQVISGFDLEVPLYLIHLQSDWMPRKNKSFKDFILKRSKEKRTLLNDSSLD